MDQLELPFLNELVRFYNHRKHKYPDLLHKIGIYSFLTGGRKHYMFTQKNLGLPSVSTIYKDIQSKEVYEEGTIRAEEFNCYLNERNLKKKIWLSEDATRIVERIQFDAKSNKFNGFSLPIDTNGLPKNIFFGNDPSDIDKYFENNDKSAYLYVVMAVSLDEKASSSFCLCAFGTNNKFSAQNVRARIDTIIDELEKFGIEVLGFSGDGDTRIVKVQKNLMSSKDVPFFSTQDAHHLVKNLKNRALKSDTMKIGSTAISLKNDLQYLVEKVPRGVHGLNGSDLDETDKMNVSSAIKICDVRVDEALKECEGMNGSRLLLRIMRCVFEPFHNKTLTLNERLGMAFYATFMMRGWKDENMADEFITNNSYVSQEINSHNLLLMTKYLRDTSEENAFLPWRMSSQTCEAFFRRLRSMTTTEMTQTNFDVKESLKRIDKILLLEETENYLKKAHFQFANKEERKNQAKNNGNFPTDVEIDELLKEVKMQAIRHLKFFGAKSFNEDLPCLLRNEDLNMEVEMEVDDEESLVVSNPVSEPQQELENHDKIIENCRAQGILLNYDGNNGNQSNTYYTLNASNGENFQVKKTTLLWTRGDCAAKPSVDRNLRFRPIPRGVPKPKPPNQRKLTKLTEREKRERNEMMELEEEINALIEPHTIEIEKERIDQYLEEFKNQFEKIVNISQSEVFRQKSHACLLVMTQLVKEEIMDYIFICVEKMSSFDTVTKWVVPHAFYLIYKDVKNLNENELTEIFKIVDFNFRKDYLDLIIKALED